MKKGAAGGLAMLGAAILGGYYLLSRSQPQTIDLGSSGLGTGGNTSLTPAKPVIPGGESISSPGVNAPDSVEKGIEDADTPSTRGLTEVSDSGTYDTSADDIASLFGEIAPWGGLALVQGASKSLLKKGATSAAGSFFSRFAAGTLAGVALKGVTRAVPVVGTVAFASDMLIGRAGDGGYTGEPYDPSNTVLEDVIAEQRGAAKTVSAVDRVTSNYGVSDTPTLSKPYTGSTIGALNVIADTPVGTTWTNTYSSQKKGTSGIAGSTNTYKASSGQQVALAGISASDYAAYLANKK